MPTETWTRFRNLVRQMKVDRPPIVEKNLEETVLEQKIIHGSETSMDSTPYIRQKRVTEEIMNRIESQYIEKNYALVDKMIKATVQTSTESVEKRVYNTSTSEHFQDDKEPKAEKRVSIYRKIIEAEHPEFGSPIETPTIECIDIICGNKHSSEYKRESNESCMYRFLNPDFEKDISQMTESPKIEEVKPKIVANPTKRLKDKDDEIYFPREDKIRGEYSYTELIAFNIDEEIQLNRKARFSSNIIEQGLGKEYKKFVKGNILEEFKILYNIQNNLVSGIIIPIENYRIILGMTCLDYSIMDFLDHFHEKEVIRIKCEGKDSFSICSRSQDIFLKNMKIRASLNADKDFYVRVNQLLNI